MPAFKPVVIITTAAGREEAERMGRTLLERKLAACVQYEDIVSAERKSASSSKARAAIIRRWKKLF